MSSRKTKARLVTRQRQGFEADRGTRKNTNTEQPSGTLINYMYSKTCLKQPLKNRQNKGLKDKW